MKKIYLFLFLLTLGPQGYAADMFPHATSYYDDLEDHYEHEYLMLDRIGEGLQQAPS